MKTNGMIGHIMVLPDKTDSQNWIFKIKDPVTGKWSERKVFAPNFKTARIIAEELNADLELQRLRHKLGVGQSIEPKKDAPDLWAGFEEAKLWSDARPEYHAWRKARFTKFVDFLKVNFPSVTTWADINPVHTQSYIRRLESDGKAYWTIKGALEPISQAWHAMVLSHPNTVCPVPRFSLKGVDAEEDDGDCLSFDELRIVLPWLRDHAPDLFPIAMLQALCGLRILEAISLRTQDVDMERGLLHATDTETHLVKNKFSDRLIPLPAIIARMLPPYLAAARKAGRAVLFVSHRKKKPFDKDRIVHRYGSVLEHLAAPKKVITKSNGITMTVNAHGLGRPELGRCTAHRLRASFATALVGEVDYELRQFYMGHRGEGTMGRHYIKIKKQPEKLNPVAEAVDRLAEKHELDQIVFIPKH